MVAEERKEPYKIPTPSDKEVQGIPDDITADLEVLNIMNLVKA
jgi:hypothetical protein